LGVIEAPQFQALFSYSTYVFLKLVLTLSGRADADRLWELTIYDFSDFLPRPQGVKSKKSLGVR
jgi:hypothetical protein